MVGAALNQSPETVKIIAAAVDVQIPTIKATSEILGLEDENRWVEFKSGEETVKAKISGSRTAITLDGETVKRKKLTVGMVCEIEYDPAHEENEPKTIDCMS
jgi:hypothetical protein